MTHSELPAQVHLLQILRLLGHAAVTVFSQDIDLRYRWIEGPPRSWKASDILGKSDAEVLPPTAAAVAVSAKREALSSGRPQWADLVVENNGASDYFDLFVEPDFDAAGVIIGVVGLALNVSDRRKQAETLEAVARDLSHRSKNLLAVIQSLATQTARAASSPEAFIDEFRGRIQSISRSQDLSIGAKNRGARLAELVETQLIRHLAPPLFA